MGRIKILLAAIVAVVIVAVVVVVVLVVNSRRFPEVPGSPGVTAAQIRANEEKVLQSYGWVDQDANIARIPIDRAIAIVAERGLPSRPASAPPSEANLPPSYTSSGTQPIEPPR